MKLRTLLLSVVLSLAPAFAQDRIIAQVESPLRTYLTLTDSQMTSLQQVQTEKRKAESAIYTQINERQRQLNALLNQGSNDAATIGRLMVEINNLRKQLPLPSDQYRASALAVLTEAQKAKVPSLAEALKISSAASEAAYYSLIDSPAVNVRPMPLPMPVFVSSDSATVDVEP